MVRFSLIAALLLCATAAQSQSSDAWFGTSAQGQLEGYIVSSDGRAELAVGCNVYEKGDGSGLSIFIEKAAVAGHLAIRVDDADPMEFDLVKGAVSAKDPGRDALFEAMIAGSKAEITMEDGQSFSFSLARSSAYLKPCL